MKSEATLKGELVRFLRQELHNSVVFRHEDIFTSGIPDISVTWNGFTTWIEAKTISDRKPFKAKEIQTLTSVNLQNAGRCVYVIWFDKGSLKETLIATPKAVFKHWHRKKDSNEECFGLWSLGFDHEAVVNFLKISHE